MTSSDTKQRARQHATRHRAATRSDHGESLAVINLANALKAIAGSGPVAGYLAIGSELNPAAAMADLDSEGRCVAVPVVDSPAKPLKFRQWHPDSSLVKAEYGISVPASGDWVRPEILVVPLLAFDQRGFRLGYGGGYYDRTLASLRQTGPTTAIGLAFSSQELKRVPTEPFDQPLDMIVTECGVAELGNQARS